MRVSKWGNSLAIRVPAAVVEALQLKEGDEVEVRLAGERTFEIDRDRGRERALARIRSSHWEWSEDMQDGMTIDGKLRILNPFRARRCDLLPLDCSDSL